MPEANVPAAAEVAPLSPARLRVSVRVETPGQVRLLDLSHDDWLVGTLTFGSPGSGEVRMSGDLKLLLSLVAEGEHQLRQAVRSHQRRGR